jgi:hypothetical protein
LLLIILLLVWILPLVFTATCLFSEKRKRILILVKV